MISKSVGYSPEPREATQPIGVLARGARVTSLATVTSGINPGQGSLSDQLGPELRDLIKKVDEMLLARNAAKQGTNRQI